MDGVSGSDPHFSRHGRRKRKMLVRHGAGDPETRRRRRTRSAMRVLLPESASAIAHPSIDAILELLNKYKTIAVVGLSSNPMRPSFGVTEYMQEAGYRIIPVNPNEREVLGEKSYARAEEVPAVVESAIRVGAKVVWMQSGVENEAAAEKALAAGLVVVEDACILVEHRRRGQSLR